MRRNRPEVQNTIQEEAGLQGVGLHTGNPSRITFRPAPPNTGIRFFRSDLPGCPMIPARLHYVVATIRGTNLGLGDARIHTVEHVLAAITGAGLDNLDVVIDANEPPAMDGSARPFFNALLSAGVRRYPDHPKRQLLISEEVCYEDKGSVYRALPCDHFEIHATLLHDHPLVPKLEFSLRVEPEAFAAEVAGARTFCFEHEVAFLRSQGLAQGGTLENAVVIGKDQIHTNAEGLRYPDEFVRHKAMDLIGDLTLIGRSLLKVRVETVRPGHAHNIEFARLLNLSAVKMRGLARHAAGPS